MAYRQWTSGQLVSAADFQSYLQNQVVAQFASASARTAAWPSPPEGACSYLVDSDRIEGYIGGGWQPLAGPQASGTITIPAVANGASYTAAVTLPTGRFSAAPKILMTLENTRLTGGLSGAPTATGFTFACNNWSPSPSPANVIVHWVALGKVS